MKTIAEEWEECWKDGSVPEEFHAIAQAFFYAGAATLFHQFNELRNEGGVPDVTAAWKRMQKELEAYSESLNAPDE